MTSQQFRNHGEFAGAIVELALLLPLLLLIFFGAIEFGLELRTKLKVTALSQELSTLVFRECWGDLRDSSTTAAACFTKIRSDATKYLNGVKASSSVRLKLWNCNASGDVASSTEEVIGMANGDVNRPSRLTNIDFAGNAAGTLGYLCAQTSPAISAEVFIPNEALIENFYSFFNRQNGYLYAVTLF